MMVPLLPAIAASFGTSVAAIGLAATAYMLPYGVCQFAYGALAARHGAIAVVRAAAIGFGLATAATAFAPGAPVLVGLRLADGVFAAAIIPLTLAYIGDAVPYTQRQATIGRLVAILSVAQSLAAGIGGTVAHLVSWRALFAGAGGLTLVPALLLFRVSPPPAAARPPGGGIRYAALLRQPAARLLLAVTSFEGVFLWGAYTYLGAVAVARYGLNELGAGLVLAAYGLAVLVGGVSLGRVRALLPEPTLAALGGGLKGAGCLLLAFAGSVPLYGAGLAMLGFGYVALHTTLQTRATELAPEARGRALALFAFALFLGGAVGSAAFGPLVARGWHRLFLVLCGGSLLGLGGLVVRLLRVPTLPR